MGGRSKYEPTDLLSKSRLGFTTGTQLALARADDTSTQNPATHAGGMKQACSLKHRSHVARQSHTLSLRSRTTSTPLIVICALLRSRPSRGYWQVTNFQICLAPPYSTIPSSHSGYHWFLIASIRVRVLSSSHIPAYTSSGASIIDKQVGRQAACRSPSLAISDS